LPRQPSLKLSAAPPSPPTSTATRYVAGPEICALQGHDTLANFQPAEGTIPKSPVPPPLPHTNCFLGRSSPPPSRGHDGASALDNRLLSRDRKKVTYKNETSPRPFPDRGAGASAQTVVRVFPLSCPRDTQTTGLSAEIRPGWEARAGKLNVCRGVIQGETKINRDGCNNNKRGLEKTSSASPKTPLSIAGRRVGGLLYVGGSASSKECGSS